MSVFYAVTVACPTCGADNSADWSASLNADRRPDLRAAILDRSFQAQDCAACGTPLRLPSHLTYLDTGRGQWILVEDPSLLVGWSAQETAAQALFDDSYGASAPAVARSLAEHMHPRLVYGWSALREKLLCHDLGLDDVTLELLKIAMLRDGQGATVGRPEALRLSGAAGATLQLDLMDEAADNVLGTAAVPRAGYDAIAADPGGWARLRTAFDGAVFVDAARMMMAA